MKNKFYVFYVDDTGLQEQLNSLTEKFEPGEEVATIATRMNKLIVLTKITKPTQIKNLLLEESKK